MLYPFCTWRSPPSAILCADAATAGLLCGHRVFQTVRDYAMVLRNPNIASGYIKHAVLFAPWDDLQHALTILGAYVAFRKA